MRYYGGASSDAPSDHADSDHFVANLNARATGSPYRWTAKKMQS
jgi:hypothetical protein